MGRGQKLVTNWEQNKFYTKIKQFLCIKRISMLTGLKYHLLHVNLYFTDQNIMQKETPWK